MCPTTTTSFSLIWESQPQLDALGLLACRCRAALLQAACWGWRDGQASTDPVSAAREVVLGFASGLSQVQRTSAGLVAQHRWQMESVEDVSEQLEPCEDETTVPTGPWEEDGNEDCPAYHTAAFRMYVMKVGICPSQHWLWEGGRLFPFLSAALRRRKKFVHLALSKPACRTCRQQQPGASVTAKACCGRSHSREGLIPPG